MEENSVPSLFDEIAVKVRTEFASSLERFAHYVVDGVLLWSLYHYVSAALVNALGELPDAGFSFHVNSLSFSLVDFGFFMILKVFFFTLIEGATGGRSPGKWLTGSVAVDEDRRPVTWMSACIRSLCRCIPFEPFSGLFGYWWHDSISRTMVIKKSSVKRH